MRPAGGTTFEGLRIATPAGVYAPRSDTALLAQELGEVRGADVLELCTGTGALALTAARRGARRVVAGDRSLRAVLAVRLNCRLNGLHVEARRGDLFDVARADERFDLILANPPYLPLVGNETRADLRWDGGRDGREVLDRIIDGAGALLRPGGRLLLVQSDLAGIRRTLDRLYANDLEVVGSAQRRGPYGPIVMERRPTLVRAGALHADGTYETLLALTARQTPTKTRTIGTDAVGERHSANLAAVAARPGRPAQ